MNTLDQGDPCVNSWTARAGARSEPPIDRVAYANDASYFRLVPQVVVQPSTIGEIRDVLRLSSRTGVSGHVPRGGHEPFRSGGDRRDPGRHHQGVAPHPGRRADGRGASSLP